MNLNKGQIDYSLYLVTNRDVMEGSDLYKAVEDALQGGVTLLQLREKNLSTRKFYNTALKMKQLTLKYNIPLIINDRLDIMLAVDAEGLHIGEKDLPLKTARKISGKDKIIGCSVSNIEEARQAEIMGADYLGMTVYSTNTKKNADEPVGTEMLGSIKKIINIPIVAIGGINEMNANEVKKSGVDGIAVVSAILGEKDKFGISRRLREIWSN